MNVEKTEQLLFNLAILRRREIYIFKIMLGSQTAWALFILNQQTWQVEHVLLSLF